MVYSAIGSKTWPNGTKIFFNLMIPSGIPLRTIYQNTVPKKCLEGLDEAVFAKISPKLALKRPKTEPLSRRP